MGTNRLPGVGLAVMALLAAVAAFPPGYYADDSFAALARRVTIRRDTFGIPHIFGETEQAAAFGFGYAQAEDHALEIARRLIRGRGEEAKYFGRSGIENDFAMRQFDNYEEAQKSLSLVTPLFRDVVHGYTAGLNRYIEQHRKQLPAWIPTFIDADVLANIRARSVAAVSSRGIPRALDQKYGTSKPTLPQQLEDAQADVPGSNAFALAGARTTSGSPILLCNPHLSWASLYWEAQVTVPRKINFFGNTLVGYPVMWAGFNDRLGWANTVNTVDLDDVYALSLDPENPDQYLFDGKPRALSRREVTVEVKGDDGSLATERRTYWYSHLGPIIHRTAGKAFAVKSSRLDAHLHFEGFYQLSRAHNLAEFLHIMRTSPVFTTNFIYADADGNILYLWNAQIPKRIDDGTDYRLDVPGDTDKYVWHQLHAIDDLPRLLNPPGGSIQNANNPPWYTSLRDRLDPARYPSYFEHGPLALRPQLALDLLDSQPKYSIEDVKRLKFSTRMLLAERVKPDLIEAIRRLPSPSEEARAGLETLQSWDNRAAIDSRGGVLFQRFWDTYSAASKQPFGVPWSEADPAKTPKGIADPGLAVRHLEQAVRWVRAQYGTERVAWGDVHRFRFRDVDLPGDGANGTYGCFRVVRYQQLPDGRQVAGVIEPGEAPVGFGDAWVLLVQFSRPVTSLSILAYGETTSWDSPHSRDQIGLFAKHELRPVWFTEAEIKAHTERTYHPGL